MGLRGAVDDEARAGQRLEGGGYIAVGIEIVGPGKARPQRQNPIRHAAAGSVIAATTASKAVAPSGSFFISNLRLMGGNLARPMVPGLDHAETTQDPAEVPADLNLLWPAGDTDGEMGTQRRDTQ